jgi:hypothetical protein
MQLECYFVSASSLNVQGYDFVSQGSRTCRARAKVNSYFSSEKLAPFKSQEGQSLPSQTPRKSSVSDFEHQFTGGGQDNRTRLGVL